MRGYKYPLGTLSQCKIHYGVKADFSANSILPVKRESRIALLKFYGAVIEKEHINYMKLTALWHRIPLITWNYTRNTVMLQDGIS